MLPALQRESLKRALREVKLVSAVSDIMLPYTLCLQDTMLPYTLCLQDTPLL